MFLVRVFLIVGTHCSHVRLKGIFFIYKGIFRSKLWEEIKLIAINSSGQAFV